MSTAPWTQNIVLRDIKGLRPHPLSVKIYGLPIANELLLESVEKLGVTSAIVVNPEGLIISGTSRHYAATKAHQKYPDRGFGKILSVLFEGTLLEEEHLVIEANRQRVKAPSVLGREFNETFRIEQEMAKARQGARTDIQPNSAESGQARDRAARLINLGRTKAEQLGKLVTKADSGHRNAKKLMDAVDKGELSVSAAYNQINGKVKPADCPVCQQTFPSMTQLLKHGRHEHKLEAREIKNQLGIPHQTWEGNHKEKLPADAHLYWSIPSLLSTLLERKVADVKGIYNTKIGETLLTKFKAEKITSEDREDIIKKIGELREAASELARLVSKLDEASAVSVQEPADASSTGRAA